MTRSALTVVTELASGRAGKHEKERDAALDRLYQEMERFDSERILMDLAFETDQSAAFQDLVASRSARARDYLDAMGESYGRFRGAEIATDRDWMNKQLTAALKYGERAAVSLRDQAARDEATASVLGQQPFARRLALEEAAKEMESLERNGLSARHGEMLAAGGYSETAIAEFHKQLLATPAEQLGFAAAEMYAEIAHARRRLADSLDVLARTGGAVVAKVKTFPFAVANPHDQKETIDLLIRRVSLPASWKLSIAAASVNPQKEVGARNDIRIEEVKLGEHYRVTLPARAEIRVASRLVPVGLVGENTTARWAVEGKIGNELIGGMVHEMYVPALIPDLELPPVGKKAAAAETGSLAPPPVAPEPSRGYARSSSEAQQSAPIAPQPVPKSWWWLMVVVLVLVAAMPIAIWKLTRDRNRNTSESPD